MVWTYDADIADDRKDETRFLVGDTNENDPLVQDEEIEYVLTLFPPADGKPVWLAAAHVCDAIAAKFARKMQQSIGPLSASNQQQYEHYVAEAARMRMLYETDGKGASAIKLAAPLLSGGGPTVLGGGSYSSNPLSREV